MASICFHTWEIAMKLLSENTLLDKFFTISLSFPANPHLSDFVSQTAIFSKQLVLRFIQLHSSHINPSVHTKITSEIHTSKLSWQREQSIIIS